MSISKKLLVGAVVVGAAGFLWYSCRNTAAAKDRQTTRALAYVPADADVVLGIDIEAMRGGVAWDVLEARLEADPEFRSLKKTCGYDLTDGIPRLTVAARDVGSHHPEGVFVIQGRGVGKLADCIAKDEDTRKEGDTYFLTGKRGKEGAMRLADSETLVGIFGMHPTKGALDEVIAKSGKSITDVAGFDEVYRQIDTTATGWFMVKGSLLSDKLPVPSSHIPKAFGGSLDIGKQIKGNFIVRFDSAADAEDVVGDARRLASFLDEAVTIDHDGADVKLKFEVSKAMTKKLLEDKLDWN